MAMKRCPICGEKYSDTYKSCPFCEEEEALQSGAQIRRTAPGRGGKRTAASGRQPNLLSPILIVLIVIMAALLVYGVPAAWVLISSSFSKAKRVMLSLLFCTSVRLTIWPS